MLPIGSMAYSRMPRSVFLSFASLHIVVSIPEITQFLRSKSSPLDNEVTSDPTFLSNELLISWRTHLLVLLLLHLALEIVWEQGHQGCNYFVSLREEIMRLLLQPEAEPHLAISRTVWRRTGEGVHHHQWFWVQERPSKVLELSAMKLRLLQARVSTQLYKQADVV